MSHRREARRKANRRQARAAEVSAGDGQRPDSLRKIAIPIALVAVAPVIATLALLGIGSDQSDVNRRQISEEVAALLTGIPQEGTTLGAPKAPITLRMFADLECRDVKHFVAANLPSIVDTWVRSGVIKLEYRPFRVDTRSQSTFAQQEIAALAAGEQNTLWNFALTFLYQQGEQGTDYVNEGFLAGIASQVPGLNMAQWRQDRSSPRLSNQVVSSDILARAEGLATTPSFFIGSTGGDIDQIVGKITAPAAFVDAAYLDSYVQSLG